MGVFVTPSSARINAFHGKLSVVLIILRRESPKVSHSLVEGIWQNRSRWAVHTCVHIAVMKGEDEGVTWRRQPPTFISRFSFSVTEKLQVMKFGGILKILMPLFQLRHTRITIAASLWQPAVPRPLVHSWWMDGWIALSLQLWFVEFSLKKRRCLLQNVPENKLCEQIIVSGMSDWDYFLRFQSEGHPAWWFWLEKQFSSGSESPFFSSPPIQSLHDQTHHQIY